MQLLEDLQHASYKITVENNDFKLTWQGEGKPDPAIVRPLLDEVKRHKPELLAELRRRETGTGWGTMSAKVRELLAERGWCAIESKVLGEVVIWARDRKVAIPDRWRDCVVYTIAEIDALMAEPRVDEEGLRRIHEAKKLLRPATVAAAEESWFLLPNMHYRKLASSGAEFSICQGLGV